MEHRDLRSWRQYLHVCFCCWSCLSYSNILPHYVNLNLFCRSRQKLSKKPFHYRDRRWYTRRPELDRGFASASESVSISKRRNVWLPIQEVLLLSGWAAGCTAACRIAFSGCSTHVLFKVYLELSTMENLCEETVVLHESRSFWLLTTLWEISGRSI